MDRLVCEYVKGSLRRSDTRNAVERILQATLHLFENNKSPSVELISFESEVSTSALYRHFSTKQRIYEATLQYVLSRFRDRVVVFISTECVEKASIDRFVDRLFDDVLKNRSTMQNMLSALTAEAINEIFVSHKALLMDETLEHYDRVFGAEEFHARRVKVEVLYSSLRNLFLDLVRSEYCPIRFQAYRSLFRSSTCAFVDSYLVS